MRIIVRYICSNVIVATFMIALVVASIESFFSLISLLPLVGHHEFGYSQAFLCVVLQLPQTLYNIFPMIGFLGSLIGLGNLSSGSELIVIRCSGFSRKSIVYSALLATMLMVLVMTVVGEWLAPAANQWSDQIKLSALQMNAVKPSSRTWLRHDNTMAYIASSPSDAVIHDVTVFQFKSDHSLASISHAKTGKLIEGRWQLYQVRQSVFHDNSVTTNTRQKMPLGLYRMTNNKAIPITNNLK